MGFFNLHAGTGKKSAALSPAATLPPTLRRAGTAAVGALLLLVALGRPLFAQEVDKLAWMTGNWVAKSAAEDVQETWLGPRANLMVATNLTFTTGRGSSFEFLRIAEKEGRAVYFASPGGRPPVEFPAKQMTADAVVFENPARDYPQRIIYRRDGDALIARIEGKRGGKDASEEWRFVRAP